MCITLFSPDSPGGVKIQCCDSIQHLVVHKQVSGWVGSDRRWICTPHTPSIPALKSPQSTATCLANMLMRASCFVQYRVHYFFLSANVWLLLFVFSMRMRGAEASNERMERSCFLSADGETAHPRRRFLNLEASLMTLPGLLLSFFILLAPIMRLFLAALSPVFSRFRATDVTSINFHILWEENKGQKSLFGRSYRGIISLVAKSTRFHPLQILAVL